MTNLGEEAATVSIAGVDDRGDSPGSEVTTTISAGASRTFTAAELESGGEGLGGALGDGEGKWRLTVTSAQPLVVMSLLSDPRGYLTNLSTAPGREPHGPPDLVVVSPSVSNSRPVAGAAFTLSATVQNDGGASSPVTVLRYYRSSDATVTATDRAVGTNAVVGLAASGSASASVELTAPSTPGTYYYGACVDAVTDESDTTNNCSASVQATVSDPGGNPDLRVSAITVLVTPGGIAAGDTFSILTTVTNAGDAESTAKTLRYYLSVDAAITTSDTVVGTGVIGALAASEASNGSVILTAPSSPGTYYYGACVDAVAGESDTTNNCSASVAFSVLDSQEEKYRDGNDTRAGAINLGDITGNTASIGENGRVGVIGGPGDRVDYFRFSLSREKRVEVALRTVHRPETRTDLYFEDAGGVLHQNTDTAAGALWLRATLPAGTYYIRAEDDSGCLSIYVFSYVVSG